MQLINSISQPVILVPLGFKKRKWSSSHWILIEVLTVWKLRDDIEVKLDQPITSLIAPMNLVGQTSLILANETM